MNLDIRMYEKRNANFNDVILKTLNHIESMFIVSNSYFSLIIFLLLPNIFLQGKANLSIDSFLGLNNESRQLGNYLTLKTVLDKIQ